MSGSASSRQPLEDCQNSTKAYTYRQLVNHTRTMRLRYGTKIFAVLASWLFVLINADPLASETGLRLPNRTTAIFYESPDQEGSRIVYKDTAESWLDVPSLLSKYKMESPALLCVKGAWLIYGHTEFGADIDDEVQLFSGNDNCINPQYISEMQAIQPVSPPKFSVSSITIFKERNFASRGKTFSADETGIQQLREFLPEIGSLIVVGQQPWSLISSNGHILCIRPRPNAEALETLPICYAVDIAKLKIDDFKTVAVAPDCPPEHHETVVANLRVADCKKFGIEFVEKLKTSLATGRSFDSALECRKNLTLNETAFTPEQSALILKLIKIRLTHDFASSEQVLWPSAKEDLWKTIPLDTVFDIVIATVPSDVVNIEYLTIIREFTVYHLNEIWKTKADTDKFNTIKEWRSHKVIVHLLNKCLRLATSSEDRFISIITAAFRAKSKIEDFNNKIHKDFKMNMTCDPVIETFYLVANYGMSICHHLFQYKLNFWDNFITTFYHLYFLPLEQRWKNPTEISPQTFRVILSGFGTEVQYKKIAFAATAMLELTPNLQPFEKEYVIANE